MLNMAQWHLAWSRLGRPLGWCASCARPGATRFSVAAAGIGMLTIAECEAHRGICMYVALQSRTRRHQIGIIYDEIARKTWAERCRGGDAAFQAQRRFAVVVASARPSSCVS